MGLNYYPGGGWVGGSNGNKANLSPARAGTGLSLAKFHDEFLILQCLVFLMRHKINLSNLKTTLVESPLKIPFFFLFSILP